MYFKNYRFQQTKLSLSDHVNIKFHSKLFCICHTIEFVEIDNHLYIGYYILLLFNTHLTIINFLCHSVVFILIITLF